AHKLTGMSFEEAAAVCDGGLNALWCLRLADLRKGQRILIYGASGAIGTAGVQLARYFGADVTAVCNTRNVETVRSLGADRVIDRCYPLEDVVDATRYVETEQKTGNVVLTINGGRAR